MRGVGGRQEEIVLLHSQTQDGDLLLLGGLGGELHRGELHLHRGRRRRWLLLLGLLLLVGDLTAGLVGHQHKLQTLLLLLQLRDLRLQLRLLLLQDVRLLSGERGRERVWLQVRQTGAGGSGHWTECCVVSGCAGDLWVSVGILQQ